MKNIKTLLVTTLLLVLTTFTNAQSVGINSNGSAPSTSAMLDVSSTAKGFLAPRMTAIQKAAIVSPATGLLIYQTDGTAGYYYYNGAAWTQIGEASGSSKWSTTGNSGTTQGTNFIGTTDDNDVVFKRNSSQAGLLSYANENTSWGVSALNVNSTGVLNTAIGYNSLASNTTGSMNSVNGTGALWSNYTGSYNTGMGVNTINNNTSGSNNTATGANSLFNTVAGDNNTALGYNSGYGAGLVNLNNCTFIGASSYPTVARTNVTMLGYKIINAQCDGDNQVILGNTTVTATKFSGALMSYVGGSYTAGTTGQVLTSQGAEVAPQWVTPSVPPAWSLTGNAGTTAGTNFIGTTDDKDVVIKRNNVQAGLLNTALCNTSWGVGALSPSTTGVQNTAIGYNTLYHNTTGTCNVAIGQSALYNNTTGSHNTAIGYCAQILEADLINATAIGSFATVGASNSLVLGNAANVGIGTSTPAAKLDVHGTSGTTLKIVDGNQAAGKVLTSDASGNASWHTAGGSSWSLTGNAGTSAGTDFIGTTDDIDVVIKRNNVQAGFLNNNNTSWGKGALNPASTGFQNMAIGKTALNKNTTGSWNTANGSSALENNTTGYDNTATGGLALGKNTIGCKNTANGSSALYDNTTGSDNTAIGASSLRLQSYSNGGTQWLSANVAIGNSALYNNQPTSTSNGINNTAVGNYSLYSNITGDNNTAIGYGADVASSGLTNATAIGANAFVNTSNTLVLGNAANVGIGTSNAAHLLTMGGGAYCNGTNWTNASDARLKRDINPMTNYGLSTVMQLKPVTYYYKADKTNHPEVGFIAQDVMKIIPEVVSGKEGDISKGETLGLSYGNLVPVLTKAIQEQQATIEAQQKQIDGLKALVNKLIDKNKNL